MRQVVDQKQAEGSTHGQKERGDRPRVYQEPRRDEGQQEDGHEHEEIHLGKTGEPQKPAGSERPFRGAVGARDQPREHPGHHETLGDRLRHREPCKPDLRQRDGRERDRDPGGGDAAQAPRHAPQADQAKDREEGRHEEGQLRRAERVPQGGQDRKQRGKAGSDRRFGGVGNQEAAREARKLARHVLRNPIPEQRRAAVRRQRAQQRIVELKRAVAGDLPAEVQVDGGVAGLHRGFVRREDQYGAQQNPRGRRQPGAAHVDQQAEPPPHDDEEDRD